MNITLVRHGITQGNIENRHIGITDIPLSQGGIELAQNSAIYMLPQDAVYSSPMLRTRQTAALLYPQSQINIASGLHERNFGLWEEKRPEDLSDDPYYSIWRNTEAEAPPMGESRTELISRCSEALISLLKKTQNKGEENIALVTHGNVIMALMTCFAGNGGEDYFSWLVDNCGGYLVQTVKTSSGLRFRVIEEHRGGWIKNEEV